MAFSSSPTTSAVPGTERSYDDAITALNSLQSNFSILEAIRKAPKKMNSQAIPEMREWVRRIGYKPSDFTRLNILHIAGTKGKGSTSAFTSSILTHHAPFHKVGLYTSPHLRSVRERIAINNTPLSEPQFTKYFFEVWDRLESSATTEGLDPGTKPVYFRFLTLVAFHTYLSENVDTAVFEVGVGGEYDSTNIIEAPTAVGITALGIDHVPVLGKTIEEIAWHKAGITKPGSKVFTVPQLPAALKVLQQRALEKNAVLEVVGVHPQIESGEVKLGLEGEFQKSNASLAVALAAEQLKKTGIEIDVSPNAALPEVVRKGLESVVWRGRCQVFQEGNIEWYFDGAHTLDSLDVAGKWFSEKINASSRPENKEAPPQRVLIFNQQTRDASTLIKTLASSIRKNLGTSHGTLFKHAVFCTNVTWKEKGYKADLISKNTNSATIAELAVQKELAKVWSEEIEPETETHVLANVEEAVEFVRGLRGGVQSLVTGSLHLVGGFLEVMDIGDGGQSGQ